MTNPTPRQLRALTFFRSYVDSWGERPYSVSRTQAGGLVRKGLLASTQQSERVRGERRVTWAIYKITPAGRAALGEPT